MDMHEDNTELPNCPNCGTPVGTQHKPGCDVERCPACGKQKLTCGCDSGHSCSCCGVENGVLLRILDLFTDFYLDEEIDEPVDVRTIGEAIGFEDEGYGRNRLGNYLDDFLDLTDETWSVAAKHIMPRNAGDKVDWELIYDQLFKYRASY